CATDNLDRALFSKACKATAERGHGIVGIAGCDCNGHGLCGFEIFQFDIEAFILEVATLKSDVAWSMAAEAHDTEIDLGVSKGLASEGNQGTRRAHACKNMPAIDGNCHFIPP